MKIPSGINNNSPTTSLFVYGTLMSPHVAETLLGRIPSPMEPATLWGYKRYAVKRQVYPAILSTKEFSRDNNQHQQHGRCSFFVEGILMRGLTTSEMKRLDWFEDVDYQRRGVKIELSIDSTTPTLSSSQSARMDSDSAIMNEMQAQTYVWNNPTSELEIEQEWSFEKFCEQNLNWYLETTVRPCREELDRLGY